MQANISNTIIMMGMWECIFQPFFQNLWKVWLMGNKLSCMLAIRIEPQAIKKFFGAAVFQKCWRGVGEQPTFAKQIKLHNKRKQTSKSKSKEPQLPSKSKGCKYGTRFQGQLRFPGKLGMCPSLAEPDSNDFPKSNVSHETPHKKLHLLQ